MRHSPSSLCRTLAFTGVLLCLPGLPARAGLTFGIIPERLQMQVHGKAEFKAHLQDPDGPDAEFPLHGLVWTFTGSDGVTHTSSEGRFPFVDGVDGPPPSWSAGERVLVTVSAPGPRLSAMAMLEIIAAQEVPAPATAAPEPRGTKRTSEALGARPDGAGAGYAAPSGRKRGRHRAAEPLPAMEGGGDGGGSTAEPQVKPEPPTWPEPGAADGENKDADDDPGVRILRTVTGSFEGDSPKALKDARPEEENAGVMDPHPMLGAGSRGLIARRDLAAGEVIAWYRGDFLTTEAYGRRFGALSARAWATRPELQYLVEVQTWDEEAGDQVTRGYLDGYQEGKPAMAALANHGGDAANASLRAQVWTDAKADAADRSYQVALVADRAIMQGDEVLIDYGGEYRRNMERSHSFVSPAPASHRTARGAAPKPARAARPDPGSLASARPEPKGAGTLAPDGEKPFLCDEEGCGSRFSLAGSLARHKRIHTGERPYECEEKDCGARFTRAINLTAHRRIHTGEKPYECKEKGCGARFTQKSNLAKHKRIHTGDKPFRCEEKGCTARFSHRGNLNQHQRTHTGEKPFACPEAHCTSSFARKGDLNRHMRLHTGEKSLQ